MNFVQVPLHSGDYDSLQKLVVVLASSYESLYAERAVSAWGTTSCTIYSLHETSVALIPPADIFISRLYSICLILVSQRFAKLDLRRVT